MTRKKYEEDLDNRERWFVSYADFITLLFAFFVVMYAISSINEGKYRVLSNALGSAFGKAPIAVGIRPENQPEFPLRKIPEFKLRMNEAKLRHERENMTVVARDLKNVLAPLVREGKVRVTQSARGVRVEINASVLFAPGEAKLTLESGQALRAVAALLKSDTHAIQVEGHTDNIPINNLMFPSNWELSGVRASSVVRLFIDSGVDENRLTAIGHGPTQPASPNDTLEGRARNRRVVVMILAALPDPVTEVPVSAGQ